jgi:methionyl-tRNA formyltransferase
LRCDKTGLYVLCQNGDAVFIGEVQGAGGKRMAADAFFRGHAKLLAYSFRK